MVLAKGALPQHLDQIPDGFNNSIRWNLGHLLAAWDHGIFPKLGRERRIPDAYHHMFPSGTSPLDAWPFLWLALRTLDVRVWPGAARV